MASLPTPRMLARLGLLLVAFSSHQLNAAAIEPDKTEVARATMVVDGSRVAGPISPMLYGQFLEYIFGCIKTGLHAELLRDRSFEESADAFGLPRDWEPYPDRRNDPGMGFAPDSQVSYPARTDAEVRERDKSLRVDVRQATDGIHGFCQGGIPVRAGAEYEGYFWLRTDGPPIGLRVGLESAVEGVPPYAEVVLPPARGAWKKQSFRLRSSADDPFARLVVRPSGRGQLWVDQASLMPADAVNGVRKDVLSLVKPLRPGFIRWPGGNVAQDYHWRWGIGPRDERTTWANLSWKNEPEPSDFGTDEYLAFCQEIGARPTIVVNVEGRGATADEAAAWVEYCNGPPSSKYGAMRAANGHPQPYSVRYWELGNELWGDWVRGHSDAKTYARNFLRYERAMRAVDPSIELIGCGDNSMDWNRTVLAEAGSKMDYLSIHHYYGLQESKRDGRNLMARPLYYESYYQAVADLIREIVPGRAIKLAINEWGVPLPHDREYSMESALYAGRLMNVFERSGDMVAMTSVSDLVNGWVGGIIQASRQKVFVSSIYVVNKLYADHLGTSRLRSEVRGPTFDSPDEGKGIPYLDAVASRTEDGRRLFIKAVNTDPKRAISLTLEDQGVTVGARGRIETVSARNPGAANGFATPDAVRAIARDIETGAKTVVELPPATVSAITLDVIR